MQAVASLAKELAASFSFHDPRDRAAAQQILADESGVTEAELKETLLQLGILRAHELSGTPQRVRFGSRAPFLNGGAPVVPRSLPKPEFDRWFATAAKAAALEELRREAGSAAEEAYESQDIEQLNAAWDQRTGSGDTSADRLAAECYFDPDEEEEERDYRAERRAAEAQALIQQMRDALTGRPALLQFFDDALAVGFGPDMTDAELARRLGVEPTAVRKSVQRIRVVALEIGEKHRRRLELPEWCPGRDSPE